MKVTQEKLPASQLGLEIEVPGDLSKQVYEEAITKLAREVSFPGFRKGKVPRQLLVQRLGVAAIKVRAIEDLVQKGLEKAIEQEKIDALGNYQLKSEFEELLGQFEPGSALTFRAAVDVPPTPTLKTYKGLTVQAEEVLYKAEKVEDILSNQRKQMATLIPAEGRPAKDDDVAVIDFSGTIDPENDGDEPEPIEGGSGTDFQVELSEGRFIPGFIEGIIGMTPGETKSVKAQFPESYPQVDVAGRDATFSITLKELKERELPELNDDFAQEVSDFDSLAALRESLEKRYKDEADQKTKQNKEEAFFTALIPEIEVELPESMVLREVNFLLNQTLNRLAEQGLDVNKLMNKELAEAFQERSRPEAETRIKRTLILTEIAKQESIEATADDIDAKLSEILAQATDTSNIDMARLRQIVAEEVLKDQIMTWLEGKNTVELVPEGTLKPIVEDEDLDDDDLEEADLDDEALEDEAIEVVAKQV
jgi:trigger factor